MPKEAKRTCCCCGELVSARTEQRHLQGQAPPRVKAAQAQKNGSRGLLKSLVAVPKAIRKFFSPPKLRASSSQVTSQSTHAPENLANLPVGENQAADGPSDTTMNDVQKNIDMGMADGFNEGESNLYDGDDAQILADIVAGAEQGAWGGPRSRRATVEDYETDDEDDAKSTWSMQTDDSIISDWDQKADGLAVDQLIDEDFEQELADFGTYQLKLYIDFP